MTEPESNPPDERFHVTAADAQRACALIIHYARGDVAGCNAILEEVRTGADPGAATGRLLFAVIGVYQQSVPLLHTPTGLAWLNTVVLDLAKMTDPK